MSRFTILVCMLMLVAAVTSVDVPSSSKPGDHDHQNHHDHHDHPELKHPMDIHKHDMMHHQEPPKMPDSKDMKFQDMQGQAKS